MKKLNQYLKTMRESNNITQRQLSTELGFSSAQFVSNVERNRCSPSLAHLKKWAKFIKADPIKCVNMLLDDYKKNLAKETGIKF